MSILTTDELIEKMDAQLEPIVGSECRVGTDKTFVCTSASTVGWWSDQEDGKLVFQYLIEVKEV